MTLKRRRAYSQYVGTMSETHGDENLVGIAEAFGLGELGKITAESVQTFREIAQCPITGEIPGPGNECTTSDGNVYSESGIRTWFKTGKYTSPLTNLELVDSRIVPAVVVTKLRVAYTEQLAKFRALCMSSPPWSCSCLHINAFASSSCASCLSLRCACSLCGRTFIKDVNDQIQICDDCGMQLLEDLINEGTEMNEPA